MFHTLNNSLVTEVSFKSETTLLKWRADFFGILLIIPSIFITNCDFQTVSYRAIDKIRQGKRDKNLSFLISQIP